MASQARLRIGNQELTQSIADGASSVTFTVQLKKGRTRLQTWLTDGSEYSHGAYYARILRKE